MASLLSPAIEAAELALEGIVKQRLDVRLIWNALLPHIVAFARPRVVWNMSPP
jgi:hypothetical protein